ncbi:hypothetical protein PT974_04614 [Cladobotryum mycophilum]|uniref:Endonuclease/exonuclease/phosphatase domain-containing protein n=1 Tax=Cladobotryum mycophilum TaxID=491253 RepID=A0ABR0SWS1_9HYPO
MRENFLCRSALSVFIFLTLGLFAEAKSHVLPGALTLLYDEHSFTLEYSTPKPSPKNWIAIYAAGQGGPDGQKRTGDALAWDYAPDLEGSVTYDMRTLSPGQYKAYYLSKDGYKWIANPVEIVIPLLESRLSLADGKSLLTFEFETKAASKENWIGLYHVTGGGPMNRGNAQGSVSWAYAPGTDGTVEVPVSHIQPGKYNAYYLADDGYDLLSDPVEVFIPGKGPLKFIVDKFTTQNARPGAHFKATISGLLYNPPDANTEFSVVSKSQGADWIEVSRDGKLSGTPSRISEDAEVVIEATASDKSKAKITVKIPMVHTGSPMVSELTVMSFNLWFGGTKVNDYHAKQVRFLANSGVDVVGVQESGGGHAIRLAEALGWHHWQDRDVGIISRYPIVRRYPGVESGGAVRIALEDNSQVIVWNVHLGYDPYGPYDFCFDHLTRNRVMGDETKSGRERQIIDIVQRMKGQLQDAKDIPVILMGDFNAPSHLDWTKDSRSQHCDVGIFHWPTSRYPTQAGLVDSYRELYKDPVVKPGITWSPIYLHNRGGSPEPKDRIDFIYHKGLETLRSETVIVGNPKPEPHHQDNEWTSDHAAVRSVFKIPKRH